MDFLGLALDGVGNKKRRRMADFFEFLLIIQGDTGGEGGIRTPDTVTRMPHFECGAFNHSATSPGAGLI
jgi:hypothetical protein